MLFIVSHQVTQTISWVALWHKPGEWHFCSWAVKISFKSSLFVCLSVLHLEKTLWSVAHDIDLTKHLKNLLRVSLMISHICFYSKLNERPKPAINWCEYQVLCVYPKPDISYSSLPKRSIFVKKLLKAHHVPICSLKWTQQLHCFLPFWVVFAKNYSTQ